MKKLFCRVLCLALCLSFAANFSAFAASENPVQPYDNFAISTSIAELSGGGSRLYLDFTIKCSSTSSTLGVSSITLYDKTTGKSTNYSVKTTNGARTYSDTITMSGVSGHSYYALVSFMATPYNGSTVRSSVVTNTITL